MILKNPNMPHIVIENCCVPREDGSFRCTAYAPVVGSYCKVCKHYESLYLQYFGECKHLKRTFSGLPECTNEWAHIGDAMEEI